MTKNPHILIVDDDNRILKLLKQFLTKNNFLISTSDSPVEAMELIENFVFDLIILDVMMPKITGIEFARELKRKGKQMPIVMLTALSEANDRVEGLESGASDYLTKPFEPRELLIRIRNLINSHQNFVQQQTVIRLGNCHYDTTRKDFFRNNEIIPLSSTEQRLMDILIENRNTPISRDELCQKMGDLNPRSVDVQIVRLRGKIEQDPKTPQLLKTVRNKGYVLYTG